MAQIRLEVLGGPGTVCRRNDLVAWFAPGTSPAAAPEVLEAAREALRGKATALRLADAVREALGGPEPSCPLALARLAEPAAVVVSGPVSVSDEKVELLAGDASMRLLEAAFSFASVLTVRVVNDPESLRRAGCLPFDLGDGIVPGGGFALHAPTPPEAPAVPNPPRLHVPQGVVLFDLGSGREQRHALPRLDDPGSPEKRPVSPSPPRQSPAATRLPAPEGPPSAHSIKSPAAQLVPGLRCARGHFNHPEALYCRQCGIGMVQRSAVLEHGPRPSLGVLILDDGTTFSLNADYVVGRSPDTSHEVRSGSARALPVDDGTGQISRSHAKIALIGWVVTVQDVGSRNGTLVLNPNQSSWHRLSPNESVTLEPGARIAIGQRMVEFQTLQRR